MSDLEQAPKASPTLLRAFVMVAWSFFGIRKGAEHRQDLMTVKPLQIVIVGIICGLLFVSFLAFVVNFVTS
jgi:CHASE2 domain-containing sensor protein